MSVNKNDLLLDVVEAHFDERDTWHRLSEYVSAHVNQPKTATEEDLQSLHEQAKDAYMMALASYISAGGTYEMVGDAITEATKARARTDRRHASVENVKATITATMGSAIKGIVLDAVAEEIINNLNQQGLLK